MELRTREFIRLCLVVALLPITQVHAEYYNNALNSTNRSTNPTSMQQAVTDGKTANAIVTSVKRQGDTGTCWSFALNAAIETSLMKQMEAAGVAVKTDNFDFSERYTAWMIYALSSSEEAKKQTAHAYFFPNAQLTANDLSYFANKNDPNIEPLRKLSQGGSILHEMSALMGNYLIEEKTRPDMTQIPELQFYPDRTDALQNKVVSVLAPTYKARDVFFKAPVAPKMGIASAGQLTQLDKYKTLIKANGSIRVNYAYGDGQTTDTKGGIYSGELKEIDHAILVVGYDDDYDFTNSSLVNKPPAKGAWIVKNSWGSTSGDAGYYYLSYYDKSAVFDAAVVAEPDIARFSLMDTHTPLYLEQNIAPVDPVLAAAYVPSFASTYKPKENQFLKAVSFITNSDGATYTIDILKNTNKAGSTPVYTQTGTFSGAKEMSGYHTVDLDEFVMLPKNEDYIIRVTVKGNKGAESVNILYEMDTIKTVNLTFADGKSYYADGNGGWTDLNKEFKGAAILNGQSKESLSANGGDFTVSSIRDNKTSNVVINLGKADEAYTTDVTNPNRKTLSNMTVNIGTRLVNKVATPVKEDFYGTIIGEGGVKKAGVGELSLRNDNTYTGTTNVDVGILNNYKSTQSNVDVKSGAKYKIINDIKQTTTSQRGINNEGSVFIIADKKGIIKFANVGDILKSSTAGKWYLNTFDETPKKKATDGTIIIDAITDDVKGNLYLQGGTIKMSSGQKKLFTNTDAIKHFGDGLNVSSKTQPLRVGSAPVLMGAPVMAVANSNIAELELGKMIIEGTTQVDMDVILAPSELTADLVKGTVIKDNGSGGYEDDDTPNKIKLGFTLGEDVNFTSVANGVSSVVAQGQVGKVINGSAFVINRGDATGSYIISYSYAGTDGTLTIKNAAAPTSLQEAITSAVTSKYYTPSSEVLPIGWSSILNGNDLTLVGNNTLIDGDNNVQVFNVAVDKMLNIKDVSVIKGTGTAIENRGDLSIVATNSEVKLAQNNGVNGGAVYNKEDVTLSTLGNNINFQNNSATNGAGIYNDTDAVGKSPYVSAITTVGDIVFDNNTALIEGGAIYNKGDVSLWADGGDIKLTNNRAQAGAGIYNAGALSVYATEKAAEFSKNIATANGGAIANNGGTVEIITQGGSINFSQNEAQLGAAIYNVNTVGAANPVVVDIVADDGNIAFNGNIASTSGGAIYNTQTVNILASENQNISFKQSTDSIYNTGTINLNYNSDYGVTNGLISTGAQLGGIGTYNLYSGELAFVKPSNNPTSVGSISHDSTLSVINDAALNLANGIKETFNPGALKIADQSALFVAIDCIINSNASEADVLNAGTYTGGTGSQIIIAAINLIKNNDNKTSYRIRISDNLPIRSAISENVLAVTEGFRSAYSLKTGDLLLLSTSVKGLVDYIDSAETTRTYSMTEDEMVIFPLGTMDGNGSTLTINGNGKKIVSEFSDISGITVSPTNTLNVNDTTFKNFETAIKNTGILNLNNVVFIEQVGSAFHDVNNSSRMTAENVVSGKVLNSGTFIAGKVNDLSNLTLRTIDASVLDLRTTTNDVNFGTLSIAGNVELLLNGVNKLSSNTVSGVEGTDSLVIKSIDEVKSASTTVTNTASLKPLIKLADDVIFTLADAAKPSVANAYKLTYSGGDISVNSVDLGDSSTKIGSHNIASSANFVASGTNTVASGNAVYMDASKSGLEINIPNATAVNGTLGFNSLAVSGQNLTVANSTTAKLEFIDSTVGNGLVLNGGSTEIKNSLLNGAITMAAPAVLSFTRGLNTVNGSIVGVAGSKISVDAPTVFNSLVDPVTETVNSLSIHNANVSEVDFIINNGGELRFTKDSYLSNGNQNTVNFNGGSLNLMNGIASTINLKELSFTAATSSAIVSSLFVDVDLANETMDKLDATTIDIGSGSSLNVAGMRLLSDAKVDNTSINFTGNTALQNIVTTSASSVAYSPIYKYLVDYNSSNGDFNFARSYNPAVLASSVAAQIGSYLTQVNTYEQAFGNMDMLMSMTAEQRQAMKYANKVAAAGNDVNLATFSPNQIPEQAAGLWFKPYATFENVGLNNGPSVKNIGYGSLFGGDTPIMELKNGWDAVYTAYAGYNGSNQNYDTVGIDQNGATLGATGIFYKGNLFTGLTANVGANAAQAYTMYGKEDFTMLAAGIASKTGYNFEFNGGKFIIQPNYLMSYTFVNTFNYTNAAGANITSDPLNAIQIVPGIKFIGNLKNGWQPYASVQMVWNIMDQTKFSANDVSLPEMSVKPYIQYGIGLQRRWGERFTGYGQAMIRNGGRNGIALQFGFRYALGKEPKKMAEGKTLKNAKLEPKKCNVNLQSYKSDNLL